MQERPAKLPNETVLYAEDGPVATITLNRPAALNALNAGMVEALRAAVHLAATNKSVRCVVVRGAGDNFMAGGDIKWFRDRVDTEPDKEAIRAEFEGLIHKAHHSITTLRTMDKPVLGVVQGAAAGFGLSLMLACDLAIAADDAVFTLAYCHIGTSPDGGSTFALPRTVGAKKAMEIALLGDRFGPGEAERLGLVNRVIARPELDDEVTRLAARLAAGPTHAYARTKALLNASLGHDLATHLDAEAAGFADCATTGDFAEGVTAFVEKAKPDFTGS